MQVRAQSGLGTHGLRLGGRRAMNKSLNVGDCDCERGVFERACYPPRLFLL